MTNLQNYARIYGIFLLTTFFCQIFSKWFHHMQKTLLSYLFMFIKFIFLTLTTKFWHFLWLSICTLPHLGSSVILYHLYVNALFISPKSMKYNLLEYKRYIEIYNHNILTKLKKCFHLIRTSMLICVWCFNWKYLNTQNIWLYLWNSHNSKKLVSPFSCEWNPIAILQFWNLLSFNTVTYF